MPAFVDGRPREIAAAHGLKWGSSKAGLLRRVLAFMFSTEPREVWTMSALSSSDCLVQPPDWPGFRMFPPLPSDSKAWNPVRVPPRARHTPSSEGVFALTCVHSAWSGPYDTGRGVCLAPRVAYLVVGERVQGGGRWTLRWLCTGVIRVPSFGSARLVWSGLHLFMG